VKILITGKNGQVGWELQRTLAPLGEVMALDRGQLNLADPDSIRAAVRHAGPSLIVNAGAYTAVDKAEQDRDLAMAVNAVAPGILAEEARRLGAAIIHYSTDYTFDGTKNAPYEEIDGPHPQCVYGESKVAGEKAVAASGAPHLTLRTSWVYGARGKNFLLTMLRLAGERDELRVVDDQVGAPTWSRMIAEATTAIVSQGRAHGGLTGFLTERGGLYHMTAAGQASWFGFAAEIVRHHAANGGRAPRMTPITTAEYPLPAKRPNYSVMSSAKLERAFGIALPDWKASLSLCLQELAR
jgi:dTDP-4-dehydrorhamnose reductase